MISIVIQARMGSSRLPGKVLAEIHGRPMLLRQIDRVARAQLPDQIVVATSELADDDPIAEAARSAKVDVYRGSSADVLERVCHAGQACGADHVIRLTADCPLSDHQIIDRIAAKHLNEHNDITSNVVTRTFPDGLDVEICRIEALRRAGEQATAQYDREHVTPWLYRADAGLRIGSLTHDTDLSEHRWTVDYPEDLDLIRKIFAEFRQREDAFSMQDIVDLLARRPELKSINAAYAA